LNKQTLSQCALYLAIATMPVLHADQATLELQITQCAVYSELDKSVQSDCADEARKVCAGLESCELPIGMNLTDGTDIDNNSKSWELVKVEYSCGGKTRINGPHYQNDHATMTLSCHH
jgi:hypothetical protein